MENEYEISCELISFLKLDSHKKYLPKDVIDRMSKFIRNSKLTDPKDSRYIMMECDPALAELFKYEAPPPLYPPIEGETPAEYKQREDERDQKRMTFYKVSEGLKRHFVVPIRKTEKNEGKMVIRRNKFGRYEFEGFVFNKGTKKVIGKQGSDGRIYALTNTDKAKCKKIHLSCEDGLGMSVDTLIEFKNKHADFLRGNKQYSLDRLTDMIGIQGNMAFDSDDEELKTNIPDILPGYYEEPILPSAPPFNQELIIPSAPPSEQDGNDTSSGVIPPYCQEGTVSSNPSAPFPNPDETKSVSGTISPLQKITSATPFKKSGCQYVIIKGANKGNLCGENTKDGNNTCPVHSRALFNTTRRCAGMKVDKSRCGKSAQANSTFCVVHAMNRA